MGWFIQEIPFMIVLFLIRSYKFVEFQLLRLFSPLVEFWVRKIFRPLGIKFVIESEENSNKILIPYNNDDDNDHKKISKSDKTIIVKVRDPHFFIRFANSANLGLGETFMDGGWDCDDLTEFYRRSMRNKLYLQYFNPWNRFLNYAHLSLFNLQTERRAFEVASKHYEIGNEVFEAILDPNMQYSCGYWANADNLNDAQIAKMDLIARKLKLEKGMTVLDIGCGWGGLCRYLAKNYGVNCVGITVSVEGAKYGNDLCKGLPVEIKVADYRQLDEKFDRVVSVGMFEHVGFRNYAAYFKVAHRCLKDDGIFLLHTCGINHQEMIRTEPFIHKYIFPNGSFPYVTDMTKYTEGLFILEDWHNFGHDYSKTLDSWVANFDKNWPKLEAMNKYDDRFYRLWMIYMKSASAAFQARMFNLWQVVYSKNGLENGYRAAR